MIPPQDPATISHLFDTQKEKGVESPQASHGFKTPFSSHPSISHLFNTKKGKGAQALTLVMASKHHSLHISPSLHRWTYLEGHVESLSESSIPPQLKPAQITPICSADYHCQSIAKSRNSLFDLNIHSALVASHKGLSE